MKKPKPWETLSTKVILNHKLLSITEDSVKLPNGKSITYVRHSPSVNDSVIVIAVNEAGNILVQKEYSYPPNKIMHQLPGGSMKPDETIEVAAKRELAEESGYSAHKITHIGSYFVVNRLSDKKQHVLLFTDLFKYKLDEDVDEFIETLWLSRETITDMIADGKIDNINMLAALNMWFCNNSITRKK